MARLNNILLAGAAPIATPGCSHFDRILGQKLRSGALEIREATPGPIVTFTTNIAKELASLIVNITPVQSGTGDPSPDNIRPISGWTGCTLSHSGADTSDPTQYTISWQTEAGTVYGGTLDVTNGMLVRTWLKSTLVGQSFEKLTDSYGTYFRTGASWIERISPGQKSSMISNIFKTTTSAGSQIQENCIARSTGSSNYLFLRVNQDIQSESELKQFLSDNNFELIYPTTAEYYTTYQLAPTQISTLLGVNNIWADTGDIAECKYYYMK